MNLPKRVKRNNKELYTLHNQVGICLEVMVRGSLTQLLSAGLGTGRSRDRASAGARMMWKVSIVNPRHVDVYSVHSFKERSVTIRREICPIRAEISTHKHGEKLYISYLYD